MAENFLAYWMYDSGAPATADPNSSPRRFASTLPFTTPTGFKRRRTTPWQMASSNVSIDSSRRPYLPSQILYDVPMVLLWCDFVLVQHDPIRQPPKLPYDVPYKVLRRSDEDIVISHNDKTDIISTDPVKPAYAEEGEMISPQQRTQSQTATSPPPTGDNPPLLRRTRSGRHVHWPDRFVAG
nr:unnamed protein product [Spirometra erinaceieuropaei]